MWILLSTHSVLKVNAKFHICSIWPCRLEVLQQAARCKNGAPGSLFPRRQIYHKNPTHNASLFKIKIIEASDSVDVGFGGGRESLCWKFCQIFMHFQRGGWSILNASISLARECYNTSFLLLFFIPWSHKWSLNILFWLSSPPQTKKPIKYHW